jgi:hypothetical protein
VRALRLREPIPQRALRPLRDFTAAARERRGSAVSTQRNVLRVALSLALAWSSQVLDTDGDDGAVDWDAAHHAPAASEVWQHQDMHFPLMNTQLTW